MTATTHRPSPLTTLAIAITLVLATSGTTALAASEMAAVAHATALRAGDTVTGTLSSAQPMHIVVALKLRNPDRLDSLIAARKTLTTDQFASLHAPTQSQAQAVAEYLKRTGFTNVVIASNHLLVSADGTANSARTAFLTSFARVHTKEGRVAFANDSDAHIPATLQDSVLSVIGLQNVHQPHILAQRLQPQVGAGTFAIAGHNPVDFSSIYGGTGVKTAAGIKIGIITQGPLDQTVSDLKLFTTHNGLATVATKTVGTNTGDQGATVEWNLDSQSIVGMGGGQVGELIFYEMASFQNADLVTDFNVVVQANETKIINVSIGECETYPQADGSAAATRQIFQAAVAQGQTFSISTGDSGADECGSGSPAASWPANSPYVVAVGGTLLDASATTWAGETVWTGAGGSPSLFEPMPAWQNGYATGSKRGLPDIAFDADPHSGALMYYYGGLAQVGGTSLAAPIFSAFWARVIAVHGTGLGFAAPHLYELPASVFHDVTAGNNGGEIAKVGYDFASGRGSMVLSKALQALSGPLPLLVSFTASINGLIVKFTDTSTDSAGAIVSRAWNFGDGGTSAAPSPSHLYARAGTYNVTETVTDNAGYVIAKTVPVTIAKR